MQSVLVGRAPVLDVFSSALLLVHKHGATHARLCSYFATRPLYTVYSQPHTHTPRVCIPVVVSAAISDDEYRRSGWREAGLGHRPVVDGDATRARRRADEGVSPAVVVQRRRHHGPEPAAECAGEPEPGRAGR